MRKGIACVTPYEVLISLRFQQLDSHALGLGWNLKPGFNELWLRCNVDGGGELEEVKSPLVDAFGEVPCLTRVDVASPIAALMLETAPENQ